MRKVSELAQSVNKEGPLRTVRLLDKWHVIGEGMLVPCASKQVASKLIALHTAYGNESAGEASPSSKEPA